MQLSRNLLMRPAVPTAVAMTMLLSLTAGAATAHDDDDWIAPGPYYRAAVTPSDIAAGATTGVAITVTRIIGSGEHKPKIKSLKIIPPAGFLVDGGADPVIVTGLDLDLVGEQAVVDLPVSVACGEAGARQWTVVAKSRDGQVLAQDAINSSLGQTIVRCRLAYLRQPALAGESTTITSVAADPSGDSIAVRLLDGNGDPETTTGVGIALSIGSGTGSAGASLSGVTADVTNANGVASFAPRIDRAGTGYALEADAGPGIVGTISDPFTVTGVAVQCSGSCSGSDEAGNTQATVTASSSGLLTLTVGLGGISCNNAANRNYVSSSEPIVFDVTSGTGRTTVVLGLAAASVTRPYKKYDVCFSSPASAFKNKFGVQIAAGDAGLLPDCRRGDDDHHHRNSSTGGSQAPCVEKRWKDPAGNVFIRFGVPPGDPRGIM